MFRCDICLALQKLSAAVGMACFLCLGYLCNLCHHRMDFAPHYKVHGATNVLREDILEYATSGNWEIRKLVSGTLGDTIWQSAEGFLLMWSAASEICIVKQNQRLHSAYRNNIRSDCIVKRMRHDFLTKSNDALAHHHKKTIQPAVNEQDIRILYGPWQRDTHIPVLDGSLHACQ